MTDKTLDLDAIEACANAATPGPWMQAHHIGEPKAIVAQQDPMMSLLGLDTDGMAIVSRVADAALIAHAREWVPALVAEVRRLRAEMEAQARELERWRHGVTIEGDYVCPNALAADLARAEEREACAAICEQDECRAAGCTAGLRLAARIRARGGR